MKAEELLYLILMKLLIIGVFLITPILGVIESFILVYKSIRSDSKMVYKLLRCVAAIIDIPLAIIDYLTVGGYLVCLSLPISTSVEMADFGLQLQETDCESSEGISEKLRKVTNDFDDCSFYTAVLNKESGVKRVA